MILWFNTPINAVILILLAVAYNLSAAVKIYDIRLLRDRKNETFGARSKVLPGWTVLIQWMELVMFITLLLLNWKFALITWVIKAILQALLVLEFIGSVILYSFNLRR